MPIELPLLKKYDKHPLEILMASRYNFIIIL